MGLIHVEQQWAENVHTVVGELMHKKAHDPYLAERRKDVLTTRAFPVSSRILGISGECDVVEFLKRTKEYNYMVTEVFMTYIRSNIKKESQKNQKKIFCS